MENAFTLLKSGPAQPDTSALRAEVAALREAAVTLEATIGRAGEELAISGAVTPGTQAQLREDLLAVLDGCAYVTKALVEVVVNTDLSALRDHDLETLRQIAASLQTAMSSFRSAIAHLSAAMGHLQAFFGTLRTLNAHLDGILTQLDAVLAQVESAADSLASAFSRMAKWAKDLSQKEPGSFTPLGPGAEESGSALNASLSGISSEISALNTALSRSNTALLSDDLRAVNAQFMKVMNLFLNVLNDTQNVNYEDVFEDVSDESLQSAARGKVLDCRNDGAVTADRNVGGIAESMAIEYDLDPEDDLLSDSDRSLRFTYQTKAILLNCQNYGTVQAKKSCAGGITGEITGDYQGNRFVSEKLAGVDRESLNELHFDTTVTAVYEPYVTTLSSDPQDAHPALLAKGRFRLGEGMEAQRSTSPVPGSGSLVETWTLTLPDDGEASHTVHWRLPGAEERCTVYLKEDGSWRKTASETIGSYLRFDLPEGAQFAVAPSARHPWQLWVLAGAVLVLLAALALLFQARRKKRRSPPQAPVEEPSPREPVSH